MKLGESNVRLHIKLDIILSQVESIESGNELQQKIAQSAKDSGKLSYATIETHSTKIIQVQDSNFMHQEGRENSGEYFDVDGLWDPIDFVESEFSDFSPSILP